MRHNQQGVRLQKWLAMAHQGSRRSMEKLIEQGRVDIDGRQAVLGDRIYGNEDVRVDGRSIILGHASPRQVWLYHKPVGEICSRQGQGHLTVFENLEAQGINTQGMIIAGRLDLNSSGLLLLTNCGDTAARIMHPGSCLLRRYRVRYRGHLTDKQRQEVLAGIKVDGDLLKFRQIQADLARGANQWASITLTQGKNREIRRLLQAVGLLVNRLMRISFGPIVLPRTLRSGKIINLTDRQLCQLDLACKHDT